VISTPSGSSVVTKSRIRKTAGHTARVGEIRNVYQILVGEYEDKTKLVRLRCVEDNIKNDLKVK
jgi:hypothetical protein